jgi:hypothetical protein
MPNHAHAIAQPLEGHELPDIVHSWKSCGGNLIMSRFSGENG